MKKFSLQELVEIKQVILEHIITHQNVSYTYTKNLGWFLHNRHNGIIMGEYLSIFMHIEYVQTMILWEVGG